MCDLQAEIAQMQVEVERERAQRVEREQAAPADDIRAEMVDVLDTELVCSICSELFVQVGLTFIISRVQWLMTTAGTVHVYRPISQIPQCIKYPTVHHFVTEMFTFLLQNGALWDMGLVHFGICTTNLLVFAHWRKTSTNT